MTVTHITLIRHGETDWNRAKRLQGHIDIGLNDEGQAQAQRLGAALASEPFDAIIASDLQRAQQTAQAVAQHQDINVQSEPRLRERCYGKLEGLTYSEIAEQHPRNYTAWQTREVDFVPEGGESLQMFYDRVQDGVQALLSKHAGQRVAWVAHGGVLDCIYRIATGLDLAAPRDFDLKNASVNRLHFSNGTLQIVEWGNVDHLEAGTLDEVDKRVA